MTQSKAIYQIYQHTSPFLHTKCKAISFPLSNQTITNINYLKQCFKQSMKQTITLGIAAPQVGIQQRFFLIPRSFSYVSLPKNVAYRMIRHMDIYINPTIVSQSKDKKSMRETCLSVKDQVYEIQRSQSIWVQYNNEQGLKFKENIHNLRARVFLHELDHLNGITIRDIKGGKKIQEQVK